MAMIFYSNCLHFVQLISVTPGWNFITNLHDEHHMTNVITCIIVNKKCVYTKGTNDLLNLYLYVLKSIKHKYHLQKKKLGFKSYKCVTFFSSFCRFLMVSLSQSCLFNVPGTLFLI